MNGSDTTGPEGKAGMADAAAISVLLLCVTFVVLWVTQCGPRLGMTLEGELWLGLSYCAPAFLIVAFFCRLAGSRVPWKIFGLTWIVGFCIGLPWTAINRLPQPSTDHFDIDEYWLDRNPSTAREDQKEITRLEESLKTTPPTLERDRNGLYLTPRTDTIRNHSFAAFKERWVAQGIFESIAPTRLAKLKADLVTATKHHAEEEAEYASWTLPRRIAYEALPVFKVFLAGALLMAAALSLAALIRIAADGFWRLVRKKPVNQDAAASLDQPPSKRNALQVLKAWILRRPSAGDGPAIATFGLLIVLATILTSVYGPFGMDNEDGQAQMWLGSKFIYLFAPLALCRLLGSRVPWWAMVAGCVLGWGIALPICASNRTPDQQVDCVDEPRQNDQEFAAMLRKMADRITADKREMDRLLLSLTVNPRILPRQGAGYLVPTSAYRSQPAMFVKDRALADWLFTRSTPDRYWNLVDSQSLSVKSILRAEQERRYWTLSRRWSFFEPAVTSRFWELLSQSAFILAISALAGYSFDSIRDTTRKRRQRPRKRVTEA